MASTMPVLDIKKHKKIDEKFIYSMDGFLKYDLFQDISYSFLPFPMYYYIPLSMYTIEIKCTFAVTDKRIIIFEKDFNGRVDETCTHHFNHNEVTIEYKKKLGCRIFTISRNKKKFFSYYDNIFTIEAASNQIKQADNIYSILLEQKH